MIISDIKNVDFSKFYGSSLTFEDPLASASDIIFLLENLSVDINSLIFKSNSTVPVHFGYLKELKKLSIDNGNGELISPVVFDMPIENLEIYNWSQKSIPLSIFRNENLKTLYLTGSYESLPTGDYYLPNLINVYFSSIHLNIIPKGDHFIPKLNRFQIYRGSYEKIPDSLFTGKNLVSLNVYSSELKELPSIISKCTKLSTLVINAPLHNGIPNLEDTVLQEISLFGLQKDDYSGCILPATLKNMKYSGKSTVSHLPSLINCVNLISLSINTVQYYPVLASDLSSLETFNAINVNDNILPKSISSARNIRRFSMMKCPISEFPNFLTECAQLVSLRIGGIRATYFPTDWKRCVALEQIVIDSKTLRITSLDFAKDLKKLKDLTLSGNYNINKYSLISKRKTPISLSGSFLNSCKFRPIDNSNRNLESLTIVDFAAALGKTKLSDADKEYFFDLFWKTPTVEELPIFDFSTFLKALNINFRPLAQLMQRRLVREVLLQHFVKMKLVKNPIAFEATDEKFLLLPDSKPMLDNVRVFLRNESADNVRLGLQMLKTGGVPAEMAEELLLLAKTDENADVRKDAQELLSDVAPPDWSDLIKNQLQFYVSGRNYTKGFFTKKLNELVERTKPKTAVFFALLLRRKYSQLPGSSTEIDEFLFKIAQSLNIEKKLLSKRAVVFINGTTSWKKTEIKEKLEAIGLKYATKYSKKVTHVLIGKNPYLFDIQRNDFQILIENFLQTYLSQSAPDFLEQAEKEGDTEMADNVMEFLNSEDAASVLVGLEMLKTGGVPERILPTLLVLQKSYDDAKVRGAAKKLLERYGPPRWLPLLNSRLIFKSIGKGGKETDNYNRLLKLEKEVSTEVASELSLLFYKKYKRGLRFLVKRGAKSGSFHQQAFAAMYENGLLNLSSGVGYTDWRLRDNLNNYYGSTSMINMSISFPKNINDLGEIREIDLHNVKVKALPKGITQFVDLEKMDASFNGLKSLPQGLKKLAKLEELDLSQNEFTSFPDRVVELTSLKKLDLRNQKTKKLEIPASVQEALPNCEILV